MFPQKQRILEFLLLLLEKDTASFLALFFLKMEYKSVKKKKINSPLFLEQKEGHMQNSAL